jgi:molybdopterin/thiamine biosynthesis adenylyltransferase
MARNDNAAEPGVGSKPRLEGLSIAVIGAGRIGSELIRNLGLMGVDRIDVFERDRQAADPLRSRYDVIDGDFWDHLTLARLRSYDFAVCTIDDRAARVRLNQKCLVANVNLLVAWTDGSLASVGAHPFAALHDCACVECNPSRGATPMQIASLKLTVTDAARCDSAATSIATASIAGALAAALIARVASGAHGSVARRATLDASLGQGASVELRRDLECPRCHALRRPMPIVQTRNRWAVSATVASECPGTLDQSLQLSDEIAGLPGSVFRLGELVAHFQGGPIPAKFALTEVGGQLVCLDFEEGDADPARPAAPRAAAGRHQST